MKPTLLQIALVLAAAAFAVALLALARSGRGGRSSRRRRPDEGTHRDERQAEAVATNHQVGTLTRRVGDFEKTLDRHAQQSQSLRTDVWQRMDEMDRRLREVERRASAPAPARDLPRDPSPPAPAGAPVDYGVETYGVPLRELAPAWSPGGDGRPVEVRDGTLVISHSLPPAAYAVPEGQGRARVFLNDSVEINEFALPKWEAFFEMRGARPYATYRTVRPAEVTWDAGAERGTPSIMGVAEAV